MNKAYTTMDTVLQTTTKPNPIEKQDNALLSTNLLP